MRFLLLRRLDHPSLEYARVEHDASGIVLDGTVVASLDGTPCRVTYRVRCTPDWRTRLVRVDAEHGGMQRSLELLVRDDSRWLRDGAPLPDVEGCVDVDLAISPITNTLPIRRLSPAEGESRDVVAAWVRFPTLEVEPLPQRYTRTGERTWHYESGGGAFRAELEVDEEGLVVSYRSRELGWARVGVG